MLLDRAGVERLTLDLVTSLNDNRKNTSITWDHNHGAESDMYSKRQLQKFSGRQDARFKRKKAQI